MVIRVLACLTFNCAGVGIALVYFLKAHREQDWFHLAVGVLIVIIAYLISIVPLVRKED